MKLNTIYFPNGNPMYQFSENNQKEGHQICWYENGNKISEYYYVNYGIVKTWHENGSRIYIGMYKTNQNGPQIHFDYKKITTLQRFLNLWK